MLNQAANLVRKQRFPMLGGSAELDCLLLVSHGEKSSGINYLRLNARSVCTGTLNTDRHIHQTDIELHTEAEAKLLQLLLDLVKRFLAEVAVLEHFRLGLLCQLANGCDVGVVQAVRSANAQFD